MRESGNHDQWKDGYPAQNVIERDIQKGASYVYLLDDEIVAVFYFKVEQEPTYREIEGEWLNGEAYGVVHRIASSGNARGSGAACLNWCFEQCHNIRIDTHRDNAPMRGLLDRLGYAYCGIIRLANGEERLAFQKIIR